MERGDGGWDVGVGNGLGLELMQCRRLETFGGGARRAAGEESESWWWAAIWGRVGL